MSTQFTPQNSSLTLMLLLACCLLALLISSLVPVRIRAQNPPCTNPGIQGQSYAWTQNSTVTVVIDSSMFTETQFNCLKTAFDNWNNSKGLNRSNVTFNVSWSEDPVATRAGNGTITAQSANVFQVNRAVPWSGSLNAGITGGLSNGTNRVAAYTVINPGVTSCEALTETMAHEIGHTFGLGECQACAAESSVMTGVLCTARNDNGTCTQVDFNDTSLGLSGPLADASTVAYRLLRKDFTPSG